MRVSTQNPMPYRSTLLCNTPTHWAHTHIHTHDETRTRTWKIRGFSKIFFHHNHRRFTLPITAHKCQCAPVFALILVDSMGREFCNRSKTRAEQHPTQVVEYKLLIVLLSRETDCLSLIRSGNTQFLCVF